MVEPQPLCQTFAIELTVAREEFFRVRDANRTLCFLMKHLMFLPPPLPVLRSQLHPRGQAFPTMQQVPIMESVYLRGSFRAQYLVGRVVCP
jgi:hypothetical protein